MPYIVTTFYHFFAFPQFETMRANLLARMQESGIKGSLLLSAEGINSTLSGAREAVDAFLAYLETEIVHAPLERKESLHETQPFKRAKVRLKRETISIGEPVALEYVGRHVGADEWNALLRDPDVILLDARNQYETHLGSFRGAIDPKIDNFKQLPAFIRQQLFDKKDKKIATFCTGGIRCEKLTSWLAMEGFKEVYHLKGGILQYFEDMPVQQSQWEGECYVFDERVAVDHFLNASAAATLCQTCDQALTAQDQLSEHYIPGELCPFCATGKNIRAKHSQPLKNV